jgi:two-component system, OmpR family, sensor histidine kinase CpxA
VRPRWTLSRKIFLLALVNLALVTAALLAFARSQFRVGPESLLLGPAHDRIRGIGDSFTTEFEAAPESGRAALLESYGKRYGAEFFLVAGRGEAILGREAALSRELLDEMRRLLPPPNPGRPPREQPAATAAATGTPVDDGTAPRAGSDARPAGDGSGLGTPMPDREGPPERRGRRGSPPEFGRGSGGRRGPPPDFDGAFGGRRPGPPPHRRLPPPPRKAAGDPAPAQTDRPPRPQLPLESVFVRTLRNPTAYWAGARLHSAAITTQGNLGILLIRSGTLFNRQLFFDWRPWLAVALIVIGVSLACWMPFIRGLTRSIAHMDRATQQIAEGRFDVQAAAPRSDELGHLGHQIDRMASRLESFVRNQKRFLGDIAHELCAPIARVQFALGILEQKTEEGQRASVAALHEEIQEMSGLVNELLSFSKAGMQAGTVALTPVAVAGVVERAVAREAFAGAAVEVRIAPELSAMANEGLLLRAVANVVRNAIRYAGDAGPIIVWAEPEGSQVAITVTDNGPGLPDEELEQVFTPFYRPDTARTRETGGAGLGLAIVRTCVEACGGTVSCRNRQPTGLEVVIRLAATRAVTLLES